MSICSLYWTLHMFNFDMLSSDVIIQFALSRSVKSFTYKNEKSRTAQSELIFSKGITLFLPRTCLQFIALISERLPAPLSPSNTIVASVYASRFVTSLRIRLQIPLFADPDLPSELFCFDDPGALGAGLQVDGTQTSSPQPFDDFPFIFN